MDEETNYLPSSDDADAAKARKPYETPAMEDLGAVRTFVQGCVGPGSDGGGAFNGCV